MSTSGVSIIKVPDKVLPLVQIYIEHVSQGNIEHLSFYRKKKRCYSLYVITNTKLFLIPHQMQRKD